MRNQGRGAPDFAVPFANGFPSGIFTSQSGAWMNPERPPLEIASAVNKVFIVMLRAWLWVGQSFRGSGSTVSAGLKSRAPRRVRARGYRKRASWASVVGPVPSPGGFSDALLAAKQNKDHRDDKQQPERAAA